VAPGSAAIRTIISTKTGLPSTNCGRLASAFGDDATIVRERNFQVLFLANTLGPLGTGLLSPILDALTGPLGTSVASVGLLMSFFTAPTIVALPLAGMIGDRYGRKPVLVASLTAYGLAGLAIALTGEFRVVLGLRAVQGVAFAGLAPLIVTTLGDIYDDTEEATAQGLRFTSSGLVSATFPLLSGVLVTAA
jgi:MFS family permease